MHRDLIDILNFAYFVFVIVLYLIITPILLHHEYKTNKEFRDLLVCEYDDQIPYEELKGCQLQRSMESLSSKSNTLILFVILFWTGLIIEKDIWPNRKKIEKWLEKLS